MRNKTLIAGVLGTLSALPLCANQQPTNNTNPAYSQSNVQAQLRLNIRENAETVHFIRDTSDPKILTKTYVLKHADAYSIRPYIREMVQALRVDYNNAAARANPDYYNVYHKDNAAKTEKIFVPTGVECIQYADGANILIVSAEAYRFADSPNGMGVDSLVAALDLPGIANSSGQPKYIYFPANRPARELVSMIKLVGANVSNDTTELIGGKDKVEVDEDLNCLFFNTALYSRKNIEEMLSLYDVAHPEVRISCTVYELDAENDGMLGMDFQSWKNNDGVKLFNTGAKWSHNADLANRTFADPANIIRPDGTVNSHYFNFQPKWNTKFLDFLVSKGKARIVSTGDIAIQTGSTGTMTRADGMLYAAQTTVKDEGPAIEVTPVNRKFKFDLSITPSVTEKMTVLNVKVDTISLLGYTSNGAARTSNYSSTQKIMLGNGRNRFYLGGIEKSQVVRDSAGVPFLKDLPLLGWIFSTERESVKKSRIVVVAECELIQPGSMIAANDLEKIELIRRDTAGDEAKNTYGYRQFLLDPER